MTKQEFLKKLEKKLDILSKEEREDTINEYRDIIDEKMKHGRTEEEAVEEAGDVNELAKEIIEAYKINPDYQKNSKTFAESTEDVIKKGAKKLSEVTEEVVDNFKKSNFEFTTENVFEIVIKIIFILFALAILKIPFTIVESLLINIFEFSFLGSIVTTIFKIIMELVYLGVCVLIVLNFIQKSFPKVEKKESEEKEPQKKNIERKETVKTKKEMNFSDICIFIIKFFVIICIIIPLFCSLIGLCVALSVIVYFMTKGILAYGILVLLLGFLSFNCSFLQIAFDLLNKKKVKCYSLFISFILTLIGGFMTIDYITGFEYVNQIDESRYSVVTNTYEETIYQNTAIYYTDNLLIDNTLEDNHIRIEVRYSNEYMEISKNRIDTDGLTKIIFYKDTIKSFKFNKNIIEDIKNQKIYNYELLGDAKIIVYANDSTIKYIK